jgi:hypothetical protein
VSNLSSYNISYMATLADKMVCCFHEVNELYDSTLNAIHSYAFSVVALDMLNNEFLPTLKPCSSPTQFSSLKP